MVAVPPGSTTTNRTERQRVDQSLHKAPPETMPTLVALQRPPALPPIGPPRRTNRTPSLNPPAILVIHPQAPLGNAVSPLVDGDGSSVFGVAVGEGTDVLSGGDDSGDQVDPYEVDNDFDGFSDEVDNDKDYSGVSEDDDKKASNPNCLDYSTDEDDEDNYIFDPDLEEFELVGFADPNKGSKKIRGRRGNISGPQPPE